ncbi:hypothetical protein D1631_15500 [Chryseobacterium nematophagum]|uniref:Uncharacterized protein n=1 Tax=Chryseobacterium nematophagum TaxID=2305228 RepID=A0A3M7TI55_9FLAO|nr:hypothetical protein [Chryseobacterium nematophagum]RNA63233.1 hypothetical protein D1631_15500 [Chryseobacterium nematophagum]
MKKIISLTALLMMIMMTALSCRQDEINDQQDEVIITNNMSTINSTECIDTLHVENSTLNPDPPIRNGTHWKR